MFMFTIMSRVTTMGEAQNFGWDSIEVVRRSCIVKYENTTKNQFGVQFPTSSGIPDISFTNRGQ
jgi:hypothetical protein